MLNEKCVTMKFEQFPYILTGFWGAYSLLQGDYQWTDPTSDTYCNKGVFIYATFIAYLPCGIIGVTLVLKAWGVM